MLVQSDVFNDPCDLMFLVTKTMAVKDRQVGGGGGGVDTHSVVFCIINLSINSFY